MQEEFHATALYGICSKSTVCKLIQEPVATEMPEYKRYKMVRSKASTFKPILHRK